MGLVREVIAWSLFIVAVLVFISAWCCMEEAVCLASLSQDVSIHERIVTMYIFFLKK